MSETMIAKAQELKEKKEKEPKVKHKDQEDPYCCTPPGGDGGPDTKP